MVRELGKGQYYIKYHPAGRITLNTNLRGSSSRREKMRTPKANLRLCIVLFLYLLNLDIFWLDLKGACLK